ncbi:unnamed protein product [marine sediment metagenome]|uniref:Uncharacterized protein n=1 Tax=marine sediment metagenome TaxID=412755 RepID=X0VGS2_9ZZZZ
METIEMDVSELFPRMRTFVEAAEAITKLDDDQRGAFADWLREALVKADRPDAGAVREVAATLGASEGVLASCGSVVRHVLLVQHRRRLASDVVRKGLREAGVGRDASAQIAKVAESLADVGPALKRRPRREWAEKRSDVLGSQDVLRAEEARLLAGLPAEYQEQASSYLGRLEGAGDFQLEEVMRDEDLYS